MAILYGIFIWIVMNLIVVPLSRVPHRTVTLSNVVINLIILIVCVGIPLSFIAGQQPEQRVSLDNTIGR